VVVVPAPTPHPVLGTGGSGYLLWATEHAGDEEFARLYGGRILATVNSCQFFQEETGGDFRPTLARLRKLLA
jgi:hypothetical protein